MNKKIGFIGIGIMGRAMCQHLLDNGNELFIYTRTKEKASELINRGAHWQSSPKEVAEKSDIVFTIVGYPKDVEEVYLAENGLKEGARENQIFVDMTTTKPSLEVRIDKELREKGARLVDAPVSGGEIGAINAKLTIMTGGEEEDVKALEPYFRTMGTNISYHGKTGSGQHAKMCNQIVIAGTMAGVSEALVYGARAGLDLTTLVGTISKGAAGCWTLDNLAPKVIAGNFEPGFMVEHFIKDMKIALEEAENMELALPSLALTKELYTAIKAQGYGRKGTQILVKALESLSGRDKC